jgi:glutathione S-transferase
MASTRVNGHVNSHCTQSIIRHGNRQVPTIKLYRKLLSGNSHRVELFLSLLGLQYELVTVDVANGENKKPEFLALNPFGLVPVLQDGDVTLAESNAILVYLEGKYAPGQWLPRDPVGAARVQRWLSIAMGPLAYGPAYARYPQMSGRDDDCTPMIARGHAVAEGDGTGTRRRELARGTRTDPRRHLDVHLHRACARRQRFARAVSEGPRLAEPDREAAALHSLAEIARRPIRLSQSAGSASLTKYRTGPATLTGPRTSIVA